MQLTDKKKSDIVFTANVGESGFEDNSLILFNKSNRSYVQLEEFFTRATDGYIGGYSEGRIKTLKAGTKKLSVDYSYINAIREDAASFLSTGDFVVDVLQDQNNYAETLSHLIACFAK